MDEIEKNKEILHSLINQKVEITTRYVYGVNSTVGRLEIDGDWAYLYDEGKNGSDYKLAINLNKKDKILKITPIQI